MTFINTVLLSCVLVNGKVDLETCRVVKREEEREKIEFIRRERKERENTIINISGGNNRVEIQN